MQPDLFDFWDDSLAETEKPRLSRQCQEILDRLRCGRLTNLELSAIALKYTGRISDLRKSGHDVRCVERNHSTGRTVYALFLAGKEQCSGT